jgi:hypothetical protein
MKRHHQPNKNRKTLLLLAKTYNGWQVVVHYKSMVWGGAVPLPCRGTPPVLPRKFFVRKLHVNLCNSMHFDRYKDAFYKHFFDVIQLK